MERPEPLLSSDLIELARRSGPIFGRHFLQLIGLTLLCYVPFAVCRKLQFDGLIPDTTPVHLLVGLVSLISESLVTLWLVRGLWDLSSDKPLSVWRSVRAAGPYFFPGVALAFAIALVGRLGLVLLIVPGLMVLASTWVALPVMILEKRGPVQSVKRSRALVGGFNGGLVFVAAVFLGLPILWKELCNSLLEKGDLSVPWFYGMAFVVLLLVTPFRAVYIVETYRELRRRTQDRDIQQVVGRFGEPDEPATDAEPSR